MTPAEQWLHDRFRDVPPRLLSTMIRALPEESDSVPDALASAAVRLYEQVLDGGGGRSDALPLLAADALLTHAFQAQAELDAAAVGEFARRWGPAGRLAEIAPSVEVP